MGIVGLLPFLANIHKKVHVSQYAGKCVAIDTSCWLHRGAFSCAFELATGQPTTRYVNYIIKRIKLLQHHKIYPIMVFDGCNAPSKKNTNEKRKEMRQNNKEKGRQLLADGDKSGAVDMFQKAISITNEMVHEVIKECYAMKVPVVVAPYEADAQLTFLVNKGLVDFAITEDSDLLPFGCKKVLFKMDDSGNAIEIDLSDLGKTTDEPRFDGWTLDKFRQMCIMSGCDYLERLPKCGLKTVHKQFRKFNNIDRGIKAFILNHNMKHIGNIDTKIYYEKFLEATQAFKHHLVFDPESETIKPLNPLPPHLNIADLTFIGEVFDKTRAIQQACGNINPHNGKKVGTFVPNLALLARTCREWRSTKGAGSAITIPSETLERSAITVKDTTSRQESLKRTPRAPIGPGEMLTTPEPIPKKKRDTTETNTVDALCKRRPTVPQLVRLPDDEGEDADQMFKIYGSGKRRKVIPNATHQESRFFFGDNASAEKQAEEPAPASNPFLIKHKHNLPNGKENVAGQRDTLQSDRPFTKQSESVELMFAKPDKQEIVQFKSTLKPSDKVSHSAAISFERTIVDLTEDSDSVRVISKLPTPIKDNVRTCGLAKTGQTKSTKPGVTAIQASSTSTILNKWISTQSVKKQKQGTLGLGKSKSKAQPKLTAYSYIKDNNSANKANCQSISKYFPKS